MTLAAPVIERPGSVDEASQLLRRLGAEGRPVRVRGGGTKLGWLSESGPPAVELETAGLARVLEHNTGDFTAVLEAGVPLAQAQAQFAAAGQMLALDPPLGDGERATIGGVVASADSGPLRHRYGGPRDLVLGVTVVLSDGTVAKAGGRVIKNVAGYDLGKLFTGSRGTLGLIAVLAVRLHPLSARTATLEAPFDDPQRLAEAVAGLAALPLEADCLDAAWERGRGSVLVRFSGATAGERAAKVGESLGATVFEDDASLWERQRARQRLSGGVVAKAAHLITDLERVLRAADQAGALHVVSRAGLGVSWIALPAGEKAEARIDALRHELPGVSVTVLDGAPSVGTPWPVVDPGSLAVMERIKARFDPARVFAPGTFAGGV